MIEDQPYAVAIYDKKHRILYHGFIESWEVQTYTHGTSQANVKFSLDPFWDIPKIAEQMECFKCKKMFSDEFHYLCPDCRL